MRERVGDGYLSSALTTKGLNAAKLRVLRLIRENGLKFDAVAFRGVSGALVAPLVAAALKKNLIVVRKDNEEAHSFARVEGLIGFDRGKLNLDGFRYILVDDFIGYGSTVLAVVEAMAEHRPLGKFVGMVPWAPEKAIALRPDARLQHGCERITPDTLRRMSDPVYRPQPGDLPVFGDKR